MDPRNQFFFSLTLAVLPFISIYLVVFIGILVFDYKSPPTLTTDHWITVAISFRISLVFYEFVDLAKCLAHRKIESGDDVGKCKLDLLIGFAGIAISSMIPRLMVFFVAFDRYTTVKTITISFSLFVIFFYLFIYGSGRFIESFNYENTALEIVISTILNFILLVATVRYSNSHLDEKERDGIVIFQIVLAAICTCSSADFLVVFNNNLVVTSPAYRDTVNAPYRSKETDLPSGNDIIFYCYTFLTGLIFISSLFYLVFTPWTQEIQSMFEVIIEACVAVAGVLWLIKMGLLLFFGNNDHIKLRIGLLGCVICGIVPRIAIFYVGLDLTNICNSQFLPLFTACFVYYLFIFGFRKTLNLDYVNNTSLITSTIIVNILAFIATIRLALLYEDRGEIELIIISQIVFSFICASSTVDFGVVLMGGVYKRKENVDFVQLPNIEQTGEVEEVQTEKPIARIKCPTCKMEYSDEKIPRILEECGHTLCEPCADAKLEAIKYISCPICYKATAVRGTASMLHKNYAALDLIQEIEQKL